MHFNENSHRAQDNTRAGNDVFRVQFPKYKKGNFIVRKVLENPTFREFFIAFVPSVVVKVLILVNPALES